MGFDFTYTPSRGPDRSHATRQAKEAVAIAERGTYAAPSGRTIAIADRVAEAIAKTADIPDFEPVGAPAPPEPGRATTIRVVNGTSLANAKEIAARGQRPFVLNFASAKNPGGGFLGGARAQEESLARASALYACIQRSPMYAHHRANPDCMYTSWMIYSPAVPVFRDDDTGALLEEPYACSFLTAAAPNAGVVLVRQPERRAELEQTLRDRIQRVLALAALRQERHLVLGAWGCGVFRNSPALVADAFHSELAGPFRGMLAEVVFAVLDWSDDRHFIRPFVERFASGRD